MEKIEGKKTFEIEFISMSYLDSEKPYVFSVKEINGVERFYSFVTDITLCKIHLKFLKTTFFLDF